MDVYVFVDVLSMAFDLWEHCRRAPCVEGSPCGHRGLGSGVSSLGHCYVPFVCCVGGGPLMAEVWTDFDHV